MRLSIFDNDGSLGMAAMPSGFVDASVSGYGGSYEPMDGAAYQAASGHEYFGGGGGGGYMPEPVLSHGTQQSDGPLHDIGETVVDVKIPAETWEEWLKRNESLLFLAGGALLLVVLMKR